jgi:hypothetical protein
MRPGLAGEGFRQEFELCLVGVMVIYKLLGHSKRPMTQKAAEVAELATAPAHPASDGPVVKAPSKATISKPVPPKEKVVIGSVSRFISENVSTAKDCQD